MKQAVRLGAVLCDPKVALTWNLIGDFFEYQGVPIHVLLHSDYEQQVEALLDGHLDIAWSSPLAWLDLQRRSGGTFRAIAMRDTDRDRRTHFVVRKDSGIQKLEDLRGRDVATGARDSPQATLIPIEHLGQKGLEAGRDYRALRFDVLVGKHGNRVGGELAALRSVQRGDAAAACMLDLNWRTWTRDGTVSPDEVETLETTEAFDHNVFAVSPELPAALERHWMAALFAMNEDIPRNRAIMDLEGLTAWVPGRTSGFDMLSSALSRTCFFDGTAR